MKNKTCCNDVEYICGECIGICAHYVFDSIYRFLFYFRNGFGKKFDEGFDKGFVDDYNHLQKKTKVI